MRQVVDDVFTRCRGVCFGTSAHGQVFTKNANKFALSADKPDEQRQPMDVWIHESERSPTILRLTRSLELANKNASGYDAAGRWIPRAGARRTTNWEEHRLRLPAPPTTHHPCDRPAINVARIVAPICRIPL